MSRTAEMGRLTKDFRQASQFRKTAIDDMRRATKSALLDCETLRGETMRDYRAQTQKFLASLVKDVAGHRRATAKHVMRMIGARRKAASQLRDHLQRDMRSLMERTHEFRDAAAQIVPALARAHRKMATRQRASLDGGRRKLRAEVAKFLGAMHADRMGAHGNWAAFRLDGATRAMAGKH